jgi:F-type H+-transporting ATPase subunit epsilon
MNLKILMPFGLFSDQSNVVEIIAETQAGSFGLLPHRLDCVAVLVPGILTIKCAGAAAQYVAIDGGVLAKTAEDVSVATRRAVGGGDLASLRNAVHADFQGAHAHDVEMRSAVAKMESAILGRILGLSS